MVKTQPLLISFDKSTSSGAFTEKNHHPSLSMLSNGRAGLEHRGAETETLTRLFCLYFRGESFPTEKISQ